MERVSVSSRWKRSVVEPKLGAGDTVSIYRPRSWHRASQSGPVPAFPTMVTSCPAWTVQVIRSGDEDAQMTGNSFPGVAPVGDGGAPNTDPDLIMGVSIFGASRLALSSRMWSPGSRAKSAQTLRMSLSSIRTIMIVSPGPVLHALRMMPTCSLGSVAPSYIWTGLGPRAQPTMKSPAAVRHPPQRCQDDALRCRMVCGSLARVCPSFVVLQSESRRFERLPSCDRNKMNFHTLL